MTQAHRFARKVKPRHQDEIRAKIQASQLVNSLQNHVTGKQLYKRDSQVTAALGLLKKILPDMRATDMTAEGGPFEGLDDDALNARLFEALRGLQEMYAIDAKRSFDEFPGRLPNQRVLLLAQELRNRAPALRAGKDSADSERVRQEAVRTARSPCKPG